MNFDNWRNDFCLGSVFRARNCLDDRIYAIKKIVFNDNTDRTRCQAKRALREVRVLASLSHPNIVQYHCAWLELVPTDMPQQPTPPPPPSHTTQAILPMQEQDSLDELIQFEGQSVSNSQQKSLISQGDDSEVRIKSLSSNGWINSMFRHLPLNQMVIKQLSINLIPMVIIRPCLPRQNTFLNVLKSLMERSFLVKTILMRITTHV